MAEIVGALIAIALAAIILGPFILAVYVAMKIK
jgi:hypothetical protein